MAAFVIGGIIGAYCVWVLRKKYRDLRDGHACCGCGETAEDAGRSDRLFWKNMRKDRTVKKQNRFLAAV